MGNKTLAAYEHVLCRNNQRGLCIYDDIYDVTTVTLLIYV